ncbi:hypothetical protein C5167_050038 [Papaver somniferum]|uniref:Uncharacterized protein n=1 Tax=Papaver somniferum TaxID=3469 RepID=A0A4Y7KQ95_PAPSO|nr:hypothetical protein C5167_050038 [Papaver somniferum]
MLITMKHLQQPDGRYTIICFFYTIHTSAREGPPFCIWAVFRFTITQLMASSTHCITTCIPEDIIFEILSSYGIVDYFDGRCASLAIITHSGRHLSGQPIKVNWAYEDTSVLMV